MTEDPGNTKVTTAKDVQIALEEAKDAIEKAFAIGSTQPEHLMIVHKYMHHTVDQSNMVASLKLVDQLRKTQQQSGHDGLDGFGGFDPHAGH